MKREIISTFFLITLCIAISIQVYATTVNTQVFDNNKAVNYCVIPSKTDKSEKKSNAPIPLKYISLVTENQQFVKSNHSFFQNNTPLYTNFNYPKIDNYEKTLNNNKTTNDCLAIKKKLVIPINPNAP